jgi:hypothetical protein
MRVPLTLSSDLAHAAGIFATSALPLVLVLVSGVIALAVIGLRAWREARERRMLKEAQREALIANANVCRGLQTMATIVPELGDPQRLLSARAMELLDTQSALLLAVWRANKKGAVRRPRARRLMAQRWREIAGLDGIYESFQQTVLMAVCEQAAGRVVMPPLGTCKYRAAFTVLEHQLPNVLWPAMNQILAQQVQLWVCDTSGTWTQARRTGFRWGREMVFSRQNLEHATELRLVVANQVVSEFTVEHERVVPSSRGFLARFGGGKRSQPKAVF